MKIIIVILAFLSFAIFSPLALAQMTADQPSVSTTMAQDTGSNTAQPQESADLLGWLVVLNKTEIVAAKEVLSKKKLNPLVKGFADFMVKQHTELLKDTMQISKKMQIEPVEGDAATSLQKEGDNLLSQLKPLDTQGVQKPYIDAMVQGHTQALSALKDYINNEKNPSLKALLKVTAGHVAMHLEKAQVIQKKLGK